MAKVKLVWRAERRKVNQLKNWASNPRKITREALEKLKDRIRARGFHDVIKIDTDNTILSGNQRKKALLDLEVKEVTALVPNRKLTEEERQQVGLESNFNDGAWDFEKLKGFDFNLLTDIGFDPAVLGELWNDSLEVEDDDFDVDKELAKIKEPKTKVGDLIALGPHRLLCGDATDLNSLKLLCGDEKASMIYSDPPYNIKLDYNAGIGGRKNYGGRVNDSRSDDEYQQFLKKTLENALSVSSDNAHVFYWCDQSYIWLIQELYREAGVNNKRVCLWIKNGFNPTPQVAFNKCYEPAIYGVRGSPYLAKNIQDLNEVLNSELGSGNELIGEVTDSLDLWLVRRLPGREYEHATSKPPMLHHKAIRRCTRPGDIILDSFAGSGSTIIAAEQLKRRVFALELEPNFCDLIIKRYERLTGEKAKLIRSDEKA